MSVGHKILGIASCDGGKVCQHSLGLFHAGTGNDTLTLVLGQHEIGGLLNPMIVGVAVILRHTVKIGELGGNTKGILTLVTKGIQLR